MPFSMQKKGLNLENHHVEGVIKRGLIWEQ